METNSRPNGKAIASLIVSCIAVLSCCIWYLTILFAVVGIVLGILALRDESNKKNLDLAVAGIVVGAVALAFAVATAVLCIMLYSVMNGGISNGSGTDQVLMAIALWK